jgi:hypothetical protein
MIDGLDGFLEGEYVEAHHEAGADDGRARAVDAEARQPADGQHQIGSREDGERNHKSSCSAARILGKIGYRHEVSQKRRNSSQSPFCTQCRHRSRQLRRAAPNSG